MPLNEAKIMCDRLISRICLCPMARAINGNISIMDNNPKSPKIRSFTTEENASLYENPRLLICRILYASPPIEDGKAWLKNIPTQVYAMHSRNDNVMFRI